MQVPLGSEHSSSIHDPPHLAHGQGKGDGELLVVPAGEFITDHPVPVRAVEKIQVGDPNAAAPALFEQRFDDGLPGFMSEFLLNSMHPSL